MPDFCELLQPVTEPEGVMGTSEVAAGGPVLWDWAFNPWGPH